MRLEGRRRAGGSPPPRHPLRSRSRRRGSRGGGGGGGTSLPDGVDEDTKDALGREAPFALAVLLNRHGGIDRLGGGTAGGGNQSRHVEATCSLMGPSQQTEQINVLVLETMPCSTENCWQIRCTNLKQ